MGLILLTWLFCHNLHKSTSSRHTGQTYNLNAIHKTICSFDINKTRLVTIKTVTMMAQMAHFSFPYYFTIPNSEFRNS